jgi:hypothetical protein
MSSIPYSRELRDLIERQDRERQRRNQRPEKAQDSLFLPESHQTPANPENAPASLKNGRACPPEGRFSFNKQGEPLPGIYEAPMEVIGQMMRQMDRAKIRRRSKDMDAPAFRPDPNQIVKIMMKAFAIEKETYRDREKGAHRGDLGALSIELLKVLIGFGLKYGQIFPSHEKLAKALRRHEQTNSSALERLIVVRLVTKHRRSKVIGTPQGERRVQDSNAYEVHMPPDETARAGEKPPQASDSKNSGVSVHKDPHTQKASEPGGTQDRFWLSEPHQRRDGSWR